MAASLRPFIVLTRRVDQIRAEHAERIRTLSRAKTAAQAQLHSSMDAAGVTSVAVGDMCARVRINRSLRALSDSLIDDAVVNNPRQRL